MTVNVQNDLGTTVNANSYISLAEYKAYHADRGNYTETYRVTDAKDTALVVGTVLSDAEYQAALTTNGEDSFEVDYPQDVIIGPALVNATDYLDAVYTWIGDYRVYGNQKTSWPRIDAWSETTEDRLIQGIPPEIKEACADLARIAISKGSDGLYPIPTRSDTGAQVASVDRELGPLKLSYRFAGSGGPVDPSYPMVDKKLAAAGLLKGGFNIRRA